MSRQGVHREIHTLMVPLQALPHLAVLVVKMALPDRESLEVLVALFRTRLARQSMRAERAVLQILETKTLEEEEVLEVLLERVKMADQAPVGVVLLRGPAAAVQMVAPPLAVETLHQETLVPAEMVLAVLAVELLFLQILALEILGP